MSDIRDGRGDNLGRTPTEVERKAGRYYSGMTIMLNSIWREKGDYAVALGGQGWREFISFHNSAEEAKAEAARLNEGSTRL